LPCAAMVEAMSLHGSGSVADAVVPTEFTVELSREPSETACCRLIESVTTWDDCPLPRYTLTHLTMLLKMRSELAIAVRIFIVKNNSFNNIINQHRTGLVGPVDIMSMDIFYFYFLSTMSMDN
jgi:hypothetical protein